MPEPDADIVPHRLVATWPVDSFVENIAPLPGGGFVVSLHNKRELHRVSPDGVVELWARTPVPPAGIALLAGVVHVVGGDPGQGPHAVLAIAPDGAVRELARVPDAQFLNGFTPAGGARGFAVDSILGAIFEIDAASGSVRPVLRHALLGKVSDHPMLPGANGIKLGDGALWITNTDREIVLRVPLEAGLPSAAGLAVVAEHLRGDDLALDSAGTLYVATHTGNTLTRLSAGGRRSVVAGPAQGMAGSTACAFGATEDDCTGLYVTTTGGMIAPFEGVVQPAKLVRLEVGVPGRPLAA